MLLNKTGLFSSIVLSVGLLTLPMAAHADLTIVNNTTEDSTSIINGGMCSVVLKGVGVTPHKQTNVVPQQAINIACFWHPNNCTAEIYMNPPPPAGQSQSCAGSPIGTVVFSTTSGIVDVKMNDNSAYKINYAPHGFHLSIDPA